MEVSRRAIGLIELLMLRTADLSGLILLLPESLPAGGSVKGRASYVAIPT